MNAQERAAREHRVKHGRPRERSGKWEKKARAFAAEHGLELKGVLDMHDHLANILEWDGAPPAEAEHYAWEQVLMYLTPRSA